MDMERYTGVWYRYMICGLCKGSVMDASFPDAGKIMKIGNINGLYDISV